MQSHFQRSAHAHCCKGQLVEGRLAVPGRRAANLEASNALPCCFIDAQLFASGRAWLLVMKSDDERAWSANDGYDDSSGSYYSYDSNVPNSQQVAPGDLVIVRNDDYLDGWSIVDRIEREEDAAKVIRRCPYCSKTNWRRRKNMVPAVKCDSCGREFDESQVQVTVSTVTKYEAWYATSWVEAARPVTFRSPLLTAAFRTGGTFNAIRPLDTTLLQPLLNHLSGRSVLLGASGDEDISGGHVIGAARRRRGQRAFRFKMMERFGERCAFTGPQPALTLEAAHLYSFAERPEHHSHGGLLLRRDCHRLFDANLLTVNPDTWRVEVSPTLAPYPTYEGLAGVALEVDTAKRPDIELVDAHYRASLEVFAAS
jgi:ribosomal protein L37AE/L43A